MKVYCGTDIIEIERVQKYIDNKDTGKAFKERIFTAKEIAYCESKGTQKYQHYAARFAAKEATFKAISKLIKDKYSISWKDIEVVNNQQGRPEVHLMENEIINTQDIDISISHCRQYAVAMVTFLVND